MSTIEKLYLGTWQFADVDESTAISLIMTAESVGIHNFDTARVYARGNAERLLGRYCTKNARIITKVPAINKHADSLAEAYPIDYVDTQIEASLDAINRVPASILLHNWREEWENGSYDIIAALRNRAISYGIGRFGVSLPNRYQGALESSEHFSYFEDIELPFNATTPSLDFSRIERLSSEKRVFARSLFIHGRDKSNIQEKILRALSTNASVVIGATNPNQIQEWKEMIQPYERNTGVN